MRALKNAWLSKPPPPARVALDRERALIFDDRAGLLWRSPVWSVSCHPVGIVHHLFGLDWLEFVEPEDVPRLLAWLRAADYSAPVEFAGMDPDTGQTHRHLWRKLPLDRHRWLVLGEILYAVEAPACLDPAGDFAPPAEN